MHIELSNRFTDCYMYLQCCFDVFKVNIYSMTPVEECSNNSNEITM